MPATAVIHPLFEMTIFSLLDRAVFCGRHMEAAFVAGNRLNR